MPRNKVWEDLVETAARHAERQGRATWRTALSEPGWWALLWFRIAQWCWDQDLRGLALWFSNHGRRTTNIHLHPAARIGRRCLFIGPAILVGEMTVLGDNCTVHAGVTLTAGSLTPYQLLRDDREPPPGRGHPTIGNNCELETGVIVQGDVFVGHDTRLLCGATITRDVPNGSVALGPVSRILKAGSLSTDLDARAVAALAQRLQALEEQVQILNFSARRQLGGPRETHNPEIYGPIPAVEKLLESAGLD